jgi:hypothetical protein
MLITSFSNGSRSLLPPSQQPRVRTFIVPSAIRGRKQSRGSPDLTAITTSASAWRPIIKDRFFFFGGIEWKFISSSPLLRTGQSDSAELNGDFSLRLAGPDGKPGTSDDGSLSIRLLRQQFQGNKILPTESPRTGELWLEFMGRLAGWPSRSRSSSRNNALYQRPNSFDVSAGHPATGLRINDKQSIYGRYIHDDYDLIDPFALSSLLSFRRRLPIDCGRGSATRLRTPG